MKRLFVVILVLVLLFSNLTACSSFSLGGNKGDNINGKNNSEKSERTEKKTDEDDPCPCCPNCVQKDCVCIKCGDSNDCDCSLPYGDFEPVTYDVELKVETKDMDPECPFDECYGEVVGTATVTMNYSSGEGYYGISKGTGEYIHAGAHIAGSGMEPRLGLVNPSTPFDFAIELSSSDINIGTNIEVALIHGDSGEVQVNWPGGEQTLMPGIMDQIFIIFTDDSDARMNAFLHGAAPGTECATLEIPIKGNEITKTISDYQPAFSLTITLKKVS